MDKSSESSNRKTRLRRGAWTPEEDRKLSDYITRYGTWNWSQLPIFAGLSRSGKSCRLRWINYLRPNIKRGNYTAEEEEVIINLHKSLGNKWTAIAANLPGRTDNDIKNHWHTHLKKRSKKSLNPKGGEKLQPDEASVNNVAGTEPKPDEASENNVDVEDYLHLFFFKHRY